MTGECTQCPNGQLHERVGLLEKQMARQTAVLENMDRNMTELVSIGKAQVRLETQQIEHGKAIDRCFDAMEAQAEVFDRQLEALAKRVKPLEDAAPAQRITHGWVLEAVKWSAILGIGVLVGKNLL